MRELVRLYALDKAGFTPAELKDVLNHPAKSCGCPLCVKFEVYLRIRDTIQAWEDAKADLTRRNTPKKDRRP